MTISKLIEALEAAKSCYGDLEVHARDKDGDLTPVKAVGWRLIFRG